ncbi:Uncharacterized protein Rs2_05035 [Raphanus sativus]|nr:Uncharacterized protein Rs2_05035 [Raphanus sativus]
MDLEDGFLPQHKSINAFDIRRVEFSSDLIVTPIIPIETQAQPCCGEWLNCNKDDSVIYMEKLIADQFIFNKAMWPGGAKTDTRLKKPKDRRQQDRKKVTTRVKQSLKLRKVIKKETTQMKQRRICSYFTRSSVNCLTNGQLTVIMLDQQKQLKQIQKLLKKKKNKTHGRPSSFNTLRTRCKKKLGHLISLNDVDLEEKENVDVDVEKNAGVDDAAMETDELPQTQSPKKKKKTHRRHTSFNTLRARCKKSGTSNQSESEERIQQMFFIYFYTFPYIFANSLDVDLEEKGNVDVDVEKSAGVDDAAMETDELPQTQSQTSSMCQTQITTV